MYLLVSIPLKRKWEPYMDCKGERGFQSSVTGLVSSLWGSWNPCRNALCTSCIQFHRHYCAPAAYNSPDIIKHPLRATLCMAPSQRGGAGSGEAGTPSPLWWERDVGAWEATKWVHSAHDTDIMRNHGVIKSGLVFEGFHQGTGEGRVMEFPGWGKAQKVQGWHRQGKEWYHEPEEEDSGTEIRRCSPEFTVFSTVLLSFNWNVLNFFVVVWLCHSACGILAPQPGTELSPPALETQSPNH